MRVHILGGGIIGLCTAYYLRKAGHDVVLIERNDITDGCSFGNMGYISPSHFVPLATPGIIRQGLKWMMSASSPFYIKPRLNMDLIRWGLAFRRKCNVKDMEKNGQELNTILQLSRSLMNDMKTELSLPFSMTEKGCWMLYKSEKTGDHEKHLAEQANRYGLKTILCNAAEVQARETDTAVDVAGGVLYLDDCHLNPGEWMKSLYHDLQQMGVKFWLHTSVTGFEKSGDKVTRIITDKSDMPVDELIIANGSWMGKTAAQLGIRMLMQPGKGYSLVYKNLPHNLQYPSILVDDRTATTPIGSWLRIGGTMEMSGHSDNILPKRVMAVYNAFKKYYPDMNLPEPDTDKAWFGYRPVSPDGLPYIGRHHSFSNICFAGGHAMLGVSLAAATGLLVSEVISGTKSTVPLSAYDPARFS
ncbi:MAG: FAD-dependent oxidoreductase [Chitinophagaceae bacterium]|nr:FAD-dependent oxidoreductase [Chitinophagaceae bacterium]